MAIDTLAKRRSALTAFQYGTIPSVEPDGSLDAPDRLAAWWGYSGNALTVATGATFRASRYSWRLRYGYVDSHTGR